MIKDVVVAGYLVQWSDEDGRNDVFFKEKGCAYARADEISDSNHDLVVFVTPLYSEVFGVIE